MRKVGVMDSKSVTRTSVYIKRGKMESLVLFSLQIILLKDGSESFREVCNKSWFKDIQKR